MVQGTPVLMGRRNLYHNQDDLAERAVQVGIMDRVYSQATQTIAWLGKQDHHTVQAQVVFDTILRIPAREIKSARDTGDWAVAVSFCRLGAPRARPSHVS